MNKEVVKKKEAELPAELMGGWGASENTMEGDLLIPKILLVQKMSKAVDEYGAKAGDYVDSITGEIIGSEKKPLDVCIFDVQHEWSVFNNDGFVRTEPVTPQNVNREWKEGGEIFNRTYNFLCIRAGDDEAMNSAFPYVFPISKTSVRAAKQLMTEFQKLDAQGLPSAARIYRFKSEDRKNDQGTWKVHKVDLLRPSTAIEVSVAREWYLQIKNSETKVRVHDEQSTNGAAKGQASGGYDVDGDDEIVV